MPLTLFTAVSFRMTAAFVLAATATATASAQQAYDTGSRYEFGRDIEALPTSPRGFDYNLNLRPEERTERFVPPYGWLQGSHEYAEGGRDSIPNTNGSDLGFEARYSYGDYSDRLELPLRYDWSSLEDEPAPAQDAGSPSDGLGLGWDVLPSGGLFGAWSDDQEEHQFTMEPFAGDDGFLPPGLSYLIEEDSSDVYIEPPSIQFDDDPADQNDSDSGPNFDVEYSFGDPFKLRLRYEDQPHTRDSEDDDLDAFEGELTIRPYFGEAASVRIDPPTLDLSADPAGPEVESVIPELAAPGYYDSSTSGSDTGGGNQQPQPEYQPLPPPRPAWKVESDHRVAVTRRWIEDSLRNEFYDVRIAHAEGTGSLEAVEEAYRELQRRYH